MDGVVEVERGERLEESAPPVPARRAPGGGRLESEPEIDAAAELVEVVVCDAPHAPQRRSPAPHPAAAPLPRLVPLDVGRPRVLLLQPHRGWWWRRRRGRPHLPHPAAASNAHDLVAAPRLLHGRGRGRVRPLRPLARRRGDSGEASFAVGGGGRGGFLSCPERRLADAGGRGHLRCGDVCRRKERVYIAAVLPDIYAGYTGDRSNGGNFRILEGKANG